VSETTCPDPDAQARELAAAIAAASEQELLQIARELLQAEPASLFAQTEFKIRDLAMKIAARAYEQHLAKKKLATKDPR
jgi:hypothetical protein